MSTKESKSACYACHLPEGRHDSACEFAEESKSLERVKWEREFFELAQVYRHAPLHDQRQVARAFGALIDFALQSRNDDRVQELELANATLESACVKALNERDALRATTVAFADLPRNCPTPGCELKANYTGRDGQLYCRSHAIVAEPARTEHKHEWSNPSPGEGRWCKTCGAGEQESRAVECEEKPTALHDHGGVKVTAGGGTNWVELTPEQTERHAKAFDETLQARTVEQPTEYGCCCSDICKETTDKPGSISKKCDVNNEVARPAFQLLEALGRACFRLDKLTNGFVQDEKERDKAIEDYKVCYAVLCEAYKCRHCFKECTWDKDCGCDCHYEGIGSARHVAQHDNKGDGK